MKACRLFNEDAELMAVLTTRNPDRTGPHVPPYREGPSTPHPDAEHLRQWRALVGRLGIALTPKASESLCAKCGGVIESQSRAYERKDSGHMTHEHCADWWWGSEEGVLGIDPNEPMP